MEKPLTPQPILKQTFEQDQISYSTTKPKRDHRHDDFIYYESIRKIHVKNWHHLEEHQLVEKPKSLNEKMLLRIQLALDDLLYFLKNQRGRKGESFETIRKTLINDRIFMELRQFKQIMYLKPDLYAYCWRNNYTNQDELFISLPQEYDLENRKAQFKGCLAQFIEKNKKLQIPECELTKVIKLPKSKDQPDSKTSLVKLLWNKESTGHKLNPKDALTNPNYFEEVLIKCIRQKEEMLKKMEEEGNTIAYNREDSEVVFDEIYKIYQSKKVSLMLEGELLSGLKKNIKKLRNEMIETITRDLMEKFPQYFGKKHHSRGTLIETNKSLYIQIRKKLSQQ